MKNTSDNQALNAPQWDSLQRFMFDHEPIRGELVHLDQTWKSVLERREYPEVLRNMMGELAAAAVLLAATLKLKGALVLQIMGKGAIQLLVVECSGDMKLRATAKWSEEKLGAMTASASLPALIGNGHFAVTLDPKDGSPTYQGIVELAGNSVAEILQNYMSQSEQLESRLWLAADGETAAGMLLQKLPETIKPAAGHEPDEDAWNRASTLADTLTPQELLELPAQEVIKRLYHEDDIRLFEAQQIAFRCTCSRESVANMFRMLGREEVDSILQEQGLLEVHCEFCNQRYEFDKVDAELMFVESPVLPPSESRH